MNYPKFTNCAPDYVLKSLTKLGGFSLKFKSAKHYKIEHTETGRCWTIPRHSRMKKGYMWDMVRTYLGPLGYSEEQIFKYIWC